MLTKATQYKNRFMCVEDTIDSDSFSNEINSIIDDLSEDESAVYVMDFGGNTGRVPDNMLHISVMFCDQSLLVVLLLPHETGTQLIANTIEGEAFGNWLSARVWKDTTTNLFDSKTRADYYSKIDRAAFKPWEEL